MSHLISTSLLSQASPALILRALESDSLVESGDVHQVTRQQALHELTGGVAVSDFNYDVYTQYVKSSRMISRDLQLKPGEHALIVNGRVSVPLHIFQLISKVCLIV
jgi:UDP-glucose:glycoprotein glucosyltransferase